MIPVGLKCSRSGLPIAVKQPGQPNAGYACKHRVQLEALVSTKQHSRQALNMKTPPKLIPILLAAGSLSIGTASAGTWTSDFSSYPNGYTYGSAFLDYGSNVCILTIAANSLTGCLAINDSQFNDGTPIESFIATLKLQIGPGTANAADGQGGKRPLWRVGGHAGQRTGRQRAAPGGRRSSGQERGARKWGAR